VQVIHRHIVTDRRKVTKTLRATPSLWEQNIQFYYIYIGNAPPQPSVRTHLAGPADRPIGLLPLPRHTQFIKKKERYFSHSHWPRPTFAPASPRCQAAPVPRARTTAPDAAPGAAPAPLPTSPDDADKRHQRKEKRRALTWKPCGLASYDCGTPAPRCGQRRRPHRNTVASVQFRPCLDPSSFCRF
jgi:hypothetical protein